LELIVGAVLASGGHVTQAFLALTPRLGWQADHWMLERGRFRRLGRIAALCRIVRREVGTRRCFVVIDDTLAPRSACCTDIVEKNQSVKMRITRIWRQNPVNSLTFCPIKTATQNHSQTNTLF
jgi:hypothetical protein